LELGLRTILFTKLSDDELGVILSHHTFVVVKPEEARCQEMKTATRKGSYLKAVVTSLPEFFTKT
jgi:hypothetical protein